MSWFFVEPGDVWTFRNARVVLGGGSIATSIFPPTPLTVQGALRSLILSASGVDWVDFRQQATSEAQEIGKIIGYPSWQGRDPSLGKFSMAGPFLARAEGGRIVCYTPLPADVRCTKERDRRCFTLQPSREVAFATNWPAANLFPLWTKEKAESEKPKLSEWLSERSLRAYLEGKGFAGLPAKALFVSEERLGIALDYSRRRPIESMLYQSEFIRPLEGVGLLFWLDEALSLPQEEGVLRLGGAGRPAYYRKVTAPAMVSLRDGQSKVTRFKIIFRTLAYFDGGWQPSPENGGWQALLGVDARLVAAAMGRPQRMGGWDVAGRSGKGLARPMYPYVPAGSVYFFESDQPVAPPQGPISQTPAGGSCPLTDLGFGQIAVGTWEWLD